jgi:hypothetical protein
MADWRQIQARIRKARNSQDPQAKLYELFQRTRDGMVAWELGVVEEKNGRMEEAARWYSTAAQRFRRADWRKKAEDALARLGVAPPAPSAEISSASESGDARPTAFGGARVEAATDEVRPPLALGEIGEEESEEEEVAPSEAQPQAFAPGTAGAADALRKKRRRGRRGGRGRRRKGPGAPQLPAQSFAEPSGASAVTPAAPVETRASFSHSRAESTEQRSSAAAEPSRPVRGEHPAPQLPSERAAHGRSDPGLASRMAQLESMLRRLLASQLHRVDETDEAPAGPGVFLLSDSDQVTSYYVEACQTLRVGLANLIRGGRTARGARGGAGRSAGDTNLKAKLAEHLEISEAKVGQYLKDHCVVRWIQLDDDAPHLAHFVIGVLRTPLNVD